MPYLLAHAYVLVKQDLESPLGESVVLDGGEAVPEQRPLYEWPDWGVAAHSAVHGVGLPDDLTRWMWASGWAASGIVAIEFAVGETTRRVAVNQANGAYLALLRVTSWRRPRVRAASDRGIVYDV